MEKDKFIYEVCYIEYDKSGAKEHKKYFGANDFSDVIRKIDNIIGDTRYDVISVIKVLKIDEILDF